MRVTEQSNPHTAYVDRATIPDMVAAIGRADEEMFGSQSWGPGLLEPAFIEKLGNLRLAVQEALTHANGRVIFSGAGTSGRLAIHAAAIYGPHDGPGRVLGLMAGGFAAFYRAAESVEDLPGVGAADLTNLLPDKGPLVFLGITCGLSAAYVAGQLDLTLKRPNALAAVLGFNPLKDAARRPLAGLGKDFLQLLQELNNHEQGLVLNPVVGPEPITGSTRMKGGTATRMILDCLFSPVDPKELLLHYQQLQKVFYQEADLLVPVIKRASKALLDGSCITYAASPGEGLTAMLDASECPPTFGAGPNQVRAFVDQGFSQLLPQFNLSGRRLEDYQPVAGEALLPMGEVSGFSQSETLQPGPAMKQFLADLPPGLRSGAADLNLKWALNLISTCAFIQCGKVYGNKMIDLKISNLKLWDRAVRIVSELGATDRSTAEACLMDAVDGKNGQRTADMDHLIRRAVRGDNVVATAVLMAKNGISPEAARRVLTASPKLVDSLDGML